jgi:hypothetical protein
MVMFTGILQGFRLKLVTEYTVFNLWDIHRTFNVIVETWNLLQNTLEESTTIERKDNSSEAVSTFFFLSYIFHNLVILLLKGAVL